MKIAELIDLTQRRIEAAAAANDVLEVHYLEQVEAALNVPDKRVREAREDGAEFVKRKVLTLLDVARREYVARRLRPSFVSTLDMWITCIDELGFPDDEEDA